jgi:hypothetical protein
MTNWVGGAENVLDDEALGGEWVASRGESGQFNGLLWSS